MARLFLIILISFTSIHPEDIKVMLKNGVEHHGGILNYSENGIYFKSGLINRPVNFNYNSIDYIIINDVRANNTRKIKGDNIFNFLNEIEDYKKKSADNDKIRQEIKRQKELAETKEEERKKQHVKKSRESLMSKKALVVLNNGIKHEGQLLNFNDDEIFIKSNVIKRNASFNYKSINKLFVEDIPVEGEINKNNLLKMAGHFMKKSDNNKTTKADEKQLDSKTETEKRKQITQVKMELPGLPNNLSTFKGLSEFDMATREKFTSLGQFHVFSGSMVLISSGIGIASIIASAISMDDWTTSHTLSLFPMGITITIGIWEIKVGNNLKS